MESLHVEQGVVGVKLPTDELTVYSAVTREQGLSLYRWAPG